MANTDRSSSVCSSKRNFGHDDELVDRSEDDKRKNNDKPHPNTRSEVKNKDKGKKLNIEYFNLIDNDKRKMEKSYYTLGKELSFLSYLFLTLFSYHWDMIFFLKSLVFLIF